MCKYTYLSYNINNYLYENQSVLRNLFLVKNGFKFYSAHVRININNYY
jgi:hypothetical protein